MIEHILSAFLKKEERIVKEGFSNDIFEISKRAFNDGLVVADQKWREKIEKVVDAISAGEFNEFNADANFNILSRKEIVKVLRVLLK